MLVCLFECFFCFQKCLQRDPVLGRTHQILGNIGTEPDKLTTCTNHQEKYEHEMAIALRSVLDMEDDDIAAMLKEKMLGLTEHLFFLNHFDLGGRNL